MFYQILIPNWWCFCLHPKTYQLKIKMLYLDQIVTWNYSVMRYYSSNYLSITYSKNRTFFDIYFQLKSVEIAQVVWGIVILEIQIRILADIQMFTSVFLVNNVIFISSYGDPKYCFWENFVARQWFIVLYFIFEWFFLC